MRIIISDTSCFIDLGKGRLVKTVLKLPYAFVMPDVLFDDELLHFGSVAKDDLCALGLQVVDLDAHGTRRAMEYFAQHKALTVNDSFALALAEQTEDCILLTGDSVLRKIAGGMGIEVHGVLWIIDELERPALLRPANSMRHCVYLNRRISISSFIRGAKAPPASQAFAVTAHD